MRPNIGYSNLSWTWKERQQQKVEQPKVEQPKLEVEQPAEAESLPDRDIELPVQEIEPIQESSSKPEKWSKRNKRRNNG